MNATKGETMMMRADVAPVERPHARGGLALMGDEALDDPRVDRARRRLGLARRRELPLRLRHLRSDQHPPEHTGRTGSRCHTVRGRAASMAASIAWNISRLAFSR